MESKSLKKKLVNRGKESSVYFVCLTKHKCRISPWWMGSSSLWWKYSMSEWSENVIPSVCPTLWDLMDCIPPGSSVHGILEARVLEWVLLQGIFLIQGLSLGLHIAGRFFTIWATREARREHHHSETSNERVNLGIEHKRLLMPQKEMVRHYLSTDYLPTKCTTLSMKESCQPKSIKAQDLISGTNR